MVLLTGCSTDSLQENVASSKAADPHELTGIRAVVAGSDQSITRAGTVTTLQDYVGRSEFKSGDKAVFTNIQRTSYSLASFTYPGDGYDKNGDGVISDDEKYEGIQFEAGDEGAWTRTEGIGPERVYWTDAESEHTFVAYGTPLNRTSETPTDDFDWKQYKPTSESSKTWYLGSLGDPTQPGIGETGYDASTNFIDYYLTPEQQATNTTTKNDVTTYSNPLLDKEDLLIAYDTKMKAEPGGSVALVKFYHALASVRVVVNISGFAASSSAADTKTKVSNMRLLHQPTMYIWKQEGTNAQPLNSAARDGTATDQDILNGLWTGTAPKYNQRKNIRLWIPEPNGRGNDQNKTFTFYGITVPQPASYVSTLDENDPYRMVELQFDVTYPNPMNPTTMQTKTYTAKLPYGETYSDGDDTTSDKGVHFEAGYNTTINISLNHKNEQMTVGAEYENWQFVATPDQGRLKMHSTFLKDVLKSSVTIANEDAATIDDATWLYKEGSDVKDIYGHTGDSKEDAYQISTAYQLLSFAYEVKSGRDFKNKFVRLDADLTLQASTSVTSPEIIPTGEDSQSFDGATLIEWLGIGKSGKPFDGTFLGGNRSINRLYGNPLFVELGENAKIEHLNVNAISINNDKTTITHTVKGGGLFADINKGRISGSRVVGDVELSGTDGYAGAFVGKNMETGAIYASYHIGETKGVGTTHVGGLVGNNDKGIISCCFQAGVVSGGTTANRGIAGDNTDNANKDNIYNTYFNKELFNYDSPSTNVVGKTTAEMTKEQFVTDLNTGIDIWREETTETVHDKTGLGHTDYDNYQYVHQPANYPKLKQ